MDKHGQQVCDPEPYKDRDAWAEHALRAIRACREYLSKWYALGLTDRYSLGDDGLKGEFRAGVNRVFSVLEHPLAQSIPYQETVGSLRDLCYDWGHRPFGSFAKPPMPAADETHQLDDLLRVVEEDLLAETEPEHWRQEVLDGEPEEMMRILTAATFMDCSDKKIRRWMDAGMPYLTADEASHRRIRKSDLLAWASGQHPVQAEKEEKISGT